MRIPAPVIQRVVRAAVRIPGVRLSRERFLRRVLGGEVSDQVLEDAVATSPTDAGVPDEVLETVTAGVVRRHAVAASVGSAVAGAPGGVALVVALPFDQVQVMINLVLLAQKLSFLQGDPVSPDEALRAAQEDEDASASAVAASVGASIAARQASTQTIRHAIARLPSKRVTRLVPVVGGVVAGASTWWLFGALADEVRAALAPVELDAAA